ncbi:MULTISPECIES: serine hydrolase domain-containing protein [Mycolicibacterium]|uniref:serine hydrolase domain-containing protein n=1 Tax=Mycolicibacterium monacense TaxID=85693 RepID=UPI0007EAB040|nr:serine hydrolase domain-containing protein [Mycolicibacterium monacense]OBF52343.1 D-alanyl-D-alanine carboxypeptidase [Mycolicibacterium monacense]
MPDPRRIVGTLAVLLLVTACTTADPPDPGPDPRAEAVMRIVNDTMADAHLKAAIVRVTEDGDEIVTRAVGESMTGVPATADMHFRNGAVAISYVATLLLLLAEDGTVSLDDRLSRWLPDVPHADRVTLGQLAQMTSGYHDYVLGNDAFADAAYADPFRAYTTDDLLDFAVHKPLQYEPGTNWSYAHTNYVLLGLALEKATGRPMTDLLDEKVLRPLGLTGTRASLTAEIPEPALHAYTSERRQALRIPDGTSFYEESTYWNPSWTITHGAIQTATIADLEATAVGIGSGKLLSPDSYRRMVSTDLRGRTRAQPGCPTCMPMTDRYTYGIGIVISGDWLLQNPMFSGYGGLEAYLPARKLAIAVAVTFAPEAFDAQGNYTNAAQTLFSRIAAELAPDDAPPVPR